VTNENKPIKGKLLIGDEILSVNGIKCTSRASAIQMVRSVDDELQLKICRYAFNLHWKTYFPYCFRLCSYLPPRNDSNNSSNFFIRMRNSD